MMYPNDYQFEEMAIVDVSKESNGWSIKRQDGWSFFVPLQSIEPKNGMIARFYGNGIGSTVRGLFLDGQKIFYRTESEDREKREIDLYGSDAKDWLNRWDKGHSVWSISMGGLGPGYEQVIQITAAEILRCLLANNYDHASWTNEDVWKKDLEEIEAVTMPIISDLGLSGAQWGVALNLACHFYKRGPIAVMTDEFVKDRHIQVQRTFPVLEKV